MKDGSLLVGGDAVLNEPKVKNDTVSERAAMKAAAHQAIRTLNGVYHSLFDVMNKQELDSKEADNYIGATDLVVAAINKLHRFV